MPMGSNLDPEKEKYLIEQAAQFIVKHGLEDFAEIILEGTSPFGQVIGELGVMFSYPFMVMFFGQLGSDFVTMMGFNYTLNAKRILARVAELREEKKRLQKTEVKKDTLFSRLKHLF
jgi:hypothetical protein